MTATSPDVELDVIGMAHGGVCVARLDGRVVFVADAIPGERVLARITDTRHDAFWRAVAIGVVEPSEHRREHVWAEASLARDPEDRAGGAELGHVELGWQRELKRQVLADALERFAGVSPALLVEPAPGDDDRGGLRWRTRVTLHVDQAGRAGPYAARSHRVVPVRALPLALETIEESATLGSLRAGVDRVEIATDDDGTMVAEVRSDRRRGPAPRIAVHRVLGREYRSDGLGFWQVHRAAAEVLAAAVLDAADPDRLDPARPVLDLYGGVGLFAGALSDRFGRELAVATVEADTMATGHAAANLADLPRARATGASVAGFLAEVERDPMRALGSLAPAGLVVLDPPRRGAGGEVVDALARLRPAQILYVACDPVALARDVGRFARRGYALDAVRAFDLFPHTHHVEAVARLVPEDTR